MTLHLHVKGDKKTAMDAATARAIVITRVVRETDRETVLEISDRWSLAAARWFVEPARGPDFAPGTLLFYKEAS